MEEHKSVPFFTKMEANAPNEIENGSKLYSSSIQEKSLGGERQQELVLGSTTETLIQFKAASESLDAEAKLHDVTNMPRVSRRVHSGESSTSTHIKPELLSTLDPATAKPDSEHITSGNAENLMDREEDIDLATEDGHPPNLDGESGEKTLSAAVPNHPSSPELCKSKISQNYVPRSVMFSTNTMTCKITKHQLFNSESDIISNVVMKIIPDVAKINISILSSAYVSPMSTKAFLSIVKASLEGRALQNYQEHLTSYKMHIYCNIRDVHNHLKCYPKEAQCEFSKAQQKCIFPLVAEDDLARLISDDITFEFDVSIEAADQYDCSNVDLDYANINFPN